MGKNNFKLKMINWIKNKYYLYNNYKVISSFFSTRSEEKILLYGYPKSGNTWLRLLLYNYMTLILKKNIYDTISFDRLNELQNNILDRSHTFIPEEGYPLFYRTHRSYMRSYDLFDKKIFIHRNPLDTLISSYYFYKNRDISFLGEPEHVRQQLHNINFYVKYKIKSWIHFYFDSLERADLVINYSDLRNDCKHTLQQLLFFLEWKIDSKKTKQAVVLSSIDNVRKMGLKYNQGYGNGPKDGSFKGKFLRSGQEGQFHQELDKQTINYVLDVFTDFQQIYPKLI